MTFATAVELKPWCEPWRGEFIECAACGYEPPRHVPGMRCPKCFGYRTFHRVVCAGRTEVDGFLDFFRSSRVALRHPVSDGSSDHRLTGAPAQGPPLEIAQ